MQVDKVYARTAPAVAISMASKQIAFVYPDAVRKFPFSSVVSWHHSWVEVSNVAGVHTKNHVIDITVRDLSTPIIKVSCRWRAEGDDLDATLSVALG